ncbi:hypothetical protein AUJ42_00510 [Candidatus Collierbacteria bacterium CG1_02_44_10]|uniref:UPF0102 protein CO104_02365 n=2 Tax=Candidatus Collieribacteriota TaxID=1752725 RepID=A0A2M8BVT6_9BACT|nr:YraN family protein [bacterium]OIN92336.1 MAG: hypothetical protein AUJ42_00510 [Candidatus Collierbacteria bacterium CG1_02_44_10]PJB47983.1 MAG: YraN family protein [Candidatus Collierbacteria bacterium CG_4_9_14_3_um_filter_43_16]
MKINNKVTGNRGEDLAVEYLEKKGYKIEERNFRTRFGEIDIVCWDAQTLVFVEVKTKIGHDFGEPEEMVDKRKMAQVQRMGEVYMRTQELKESRTQDEERWKGACRVDVVAIVLKENGEVEKLEHYEAVY